MKYFIIFLLTTFSLMAQDYCEICGKPAEYNYSNGWEVDTMLYNIMHRTVDVLRIQDIPVCRPCYNKYNNTLTDIVNSVTKAIIENAKNENREQREAFIKERKENELRDLLDKGNEIDKRIKNLENQGIKPSKPRMSETKENFDRMIQITDSIKIGKMDTTIIKKPSEKTGVPFDLKH